MKVIGSIPKMEPVWELLLTDELLMSLCGFNAYGDGHESAYEGLFDGARGTKPILVR